MAQIRMYDLSKPYLYLANYEMLAVPMNLVKLLQNFQRLVDVHKWFIIVMNITRQHFYCNLAAYDDFRKMKHFVAIRLRDMR